MKNILIDTTTTSHTSAATGIQRVTRCLFFELSQITNTIPVCHDPFLGQWRHLTKKERLTLSSVSPKGRGRGEVWPLHSRCSGLLFRFLQREPQKLGTSQALIVPEIFSQERYDAFPTLFKHVTGPKIALFHDALALKLPEFSPASTLARFPKYLKELAIFDGIAAVSEDSAACLQDYWKWLGLKAPPPVKAIPLGIESLGSKYAEHFTGMTTSRPIILSVGTVEGRKNHLALLGAVEDLWRQGFSFELEIIGTSHPVTGHSALLKIKELIEAGFPLRYLGPVNDNLLAQRYRAASFTVYPSLLEGFGLPILESLSFGKPCICSQDGAIGEAARLGGCVTLPSMHEAYIRDGILSLLKNPEKLQALTHQARARQIKTFKEYVRELLEWLGTLARSKAE